ncbi:hypothetical protein NIES2119_15705 [[Phormidium ambiguum] IAM M-71]|uniref:Uncharacterized protein n=1 Tax=[Phormidium ambiguum] IAM M-71 TaxID=454136 RepID=A0A1U7IIC6_9CYAN|nr:hypothetical protein NIES2119_15705 [Phormidium ambiguum IAM M-71]
MGRWGAGEQGSRGAGGQGSRGAGEQGSRGAGGRGAGRYFTSAFCLSSLLPSAFCLLPSQQSCPNYDK